MANMNLVTGHAGTNHVTAADDGAFNAVVAGGGQYVSNRGRKLEASVISNNTVRIFDGDILMQGRHIRINDDTHVDLTITNGTSGYNRNDLIVARYSKDSNDGTEQANLVVIKGTAVTGTASDPTWTSGNIFAGATQNDMPLYRIPLTGISVGTPVPLFETLDSYSDHATNRENPHGVTAAQVGAKASNAVEQIASGGTGATTAAQARHNLGAAASSHTHNVADINGTLPVEKGGTGGNTLNAAKQNLGIPTFEVDGTTLTITL